MYAAKLTGSTKALMQYAGNEQLGYYASHNNVTLRHLAAIMYAPVSIIITTKLMLHNS